MSLIDRRRFLELTTASVASTFFLSSSLMPTRAYAHSTSLFSDEPTWEDMRREFLLRDDLIMLNAASLSPMPKKLIERQNQLALAIDQDPSFSNRDRFWNMYRDSVESLARFINASFDEVAITRNTSESNNVVIKGLDLVPGDEVIIWMENHPSNNLAWDEEARRKGFIVRKITTPKIINSVDDLISPFINAMSEKSRVLALTHVNNDTGVRLPIKQIAAAARERGIFTLVDGAQSLGALNVDVRDLQVDAFTGSLHKWPCGPKETGLLYLRKDVHMRIHPSIVTVDFQEGPYLCSGRFSAMSQRNDAAIAVIKDMVDFHEWLGRENIEHRLLTLATMLKDKLRRAIPSVCFTTPSAKELSAGIVFFNVPTIVDYRNVLYDFYDQFHIAIDSWNHFDSFYAGLRACPHVYNTERDLDLFVDAVCRVSVTIR